MIKNKRTPEEWAKLKKEWAEAKAGGMKQRVFCEAHGIASSVFWQNIGPSKPGQNKITQTEIKKNHNFVKFVPVGTVSNLITINLPSGIKIELDSSNSNALDAVISAFTKTIGN